MIILIILLIWLIPPFLLFCLEFTECYIFLKQCKIGPILIKDVTYRMFTDERIFVGILAFSFMPFIGVLILLVFVPIYYPRLQNFYGRICRKLYLIISYPFRMVERICVSICKFIGNIKIG